MRLSRLLTTCLMIMASLSLTCCNEAVPDYSPFAQGLQALSVCLFACAAVKALAEIIMGHPPLPPTPPTAPPLPPPVNPTTRSTTKKPTA